MSRYWTPRNIGGSRSPEALIYGAVDGEGFEGIGFSVNAPAQKLALVSDAPADRRHADRRQRPTPFLCRHTFYGGRRKNVRRDAEGGGEFVDFWGSGLFFVVTAIVLLNFLDAWFTVYLLSWGGSEMNPLIDAVLKVGIGAFVFVKSIGIGICAGVLTLTSRYPIAKVGLGVVLAGYTLLLGWHIYLLNHLP